MGRSTGCTAARIFFFGYLNLFHSRHNFATTEIDFKVDSRCWGRFRSSTRVNHDFTLDSATDTGTPRVQRRKAGRIRKLRDAAGPRWMWRFTCVAGTGGGGQAGYGRCFRENS
jgi:hypothetical protein